jgi:hypothetical protein
MEKPKASHDYSDASQTFISFIKFKYFFIKLTILDKNFTLASQHEYNYLKVIIILIDFHFNYQSSDSRPLI